MTGLNGYLLFLALLFAAVVAAVITFVAGWAAAVGLALLILAVVIFARWPVDVSK